MTSQFFHFYALAKFWLRPWMEQNKQTSIDTRLHRNTCNN